MHLKAAAQMIGLDSGTLGWAMLEKVVLDAEVGDEWAEVWNAIVSGKVCSFFLGGFLKFVYVAKTYFVPSR